MKNLTVYSIFSAWTHFIPKSVLALFLGFLLMAKSQVYCTFYHILNLVSMYRVKTTLNSIRPQLSFIAFVLAIGMIEAQTYNRCILPVTPLRSNELIISHNINRSCPPVAGHSVTEYTIQTVTGQEPTGSKINICALQPGLSALPARWVTVSSQNCNCCSGVKSSPNQLTIQKIGCAMPPKTLSSSNLTTVSATVSWTAVAGAVSYKLRYKPVNLPTWTTVVVAAPQVKSVLANLSSNTKYEFQVSTKCTVDEGVFTASTYFTTKKVSAVIGSNSTNSSNIGGRAGESVQLTEMALKLSPNPADKTVTLAIDAIEEGHYDIQLFDMLGKTAIQKKVYLYEGQQAEQIDISSLAQGTYLLRLINRNAVSIQKLVIKH